MRLVVQQGRDVEKITRLHHEERLFSTVERKLVQPHPAGGDDVESASNFALQKESRFVGVGVEMEIVSDFFEFDFGQAGKESHAG